MHMHKLNKYISLSLYNTLTTITHAYAMHSAYCILTNHSIDEKFVFVLASHTLCAWYAYALTAIHCFLLLCLTSLSVQVFSRGYAFTGFQ